MVFSYIGRFLALENMFLVKQTPSIVIDFEMCTPRPIVHVKAGKASAIGRVKPNLPHFFTGETWSTV